MKTNRKSTTRRASKNDLSEKAASFFGSLSKDAEGRRLLAEQNHRIEFDLTDSPPFYVQVRSGKITVKNGVVKPARYDVNDLIHFQLSSQTLGRLLDAKIRYTDALIPIDAKEAMLLLECTLFKWSVLNWVGRLFRGAQVRTSRAI